jgi:hypothetical protein
MWKTLLEVLVSFLKTWWDAEQSEAHEWEAKARAGQVEAMKNVRQVEKRIDAAAVEGTASNAVRAWNEKARGAAPTGLLLLLAVGLCCPGCLFTKYVYVEGPWPVIAVNPRPALPEDPPNFSDREVILVDYAKHLEGKVRAYNVEAQKHNVKHGYNDPEGGENVGEASEADPPG